MHAAGSFGWLTRDVLEAAFHYPFEVCGVNIVLGFIPSGNIDAIRFNTHLGFDTLLSIDKGHPDGSLIIMGMRREKCRFLNRKHHGHEERRTTRSRG